MIKISAVVITYNEESKIELCLQSLKGVADEIIVVDSFSTDTTKAICLQYGAQFFERRWSGYGAQKNWGNSQAENNHILSLDADEYLSSELRESIIAVKSNWTRDAYTFNRLNVFCGNPIKHCSWYPDRKIRLWDIRKGSWDSAAVHELVRMENNASVGYLEGDLIHYSFSSIADHISRSLKYSDLWVEKSVKRAKTVSLAKLLAVMPWHFFSHYVIKLGFLDGSAGLMVSAGSAYAAFMKYAMLYQYKMTRKRLRVVPGNDNNAAQLVIYVEVSNVERLLLCLRSIRENSRYEHQVVLEGVKTEELRLWLKTHSVYNRFVQIADSDTLLEPSRCKVYMKDELYLTKDWDYFLGQEV